MSKTMVLHVIYKSLYISYSRPLQNNNVKLPNTALSEEGELRRLICFHFKFIAVSQIQFRDSFDSDKQS